MQIDDQYTIDLNNIIGRGSFSEVFLGYDLKRKNKVAIKVIYKKDNLKKIIENEISILKILQKNSHDNIIKCYQIIDCDETNKIYIVMEYCNGSSLREVIDTQLKNKKPFSEKAIQSIFSQMVKGFYFMYTINLVHRDIKPENILILDGVIKICDFGLSKIAEEDALYNTICGSPIYMPYEMLSNQEYNYKVDIWALGIVLYELLYLSHPFFECKSLSDIVYTKSSNKIIIKKEKPYSDQYYPDHIIDFLKKFLDNQDNRLSWKEIISYQWVEYTKTQVFKSLTYDRIKNNMPFDVISNYHDNKFHKSGEYEVINDELIFEIDILK